ncbi:MAG: tetratricopeptide repeat protein [Nitrospirae bacterium]|nr:tetratricopeptide repeat protein [Nitrospirota bacterium]
MLKNKQLLMIYIFLTVATLMAFWQVIHCDFTNYDDPYYVTKNPHVQNGVTLEGIRWAFTTIHFANWHPLTWISHMTDVQLFGLNPGWHHGTNLLFHLANMLLLFFVLHRMTKSLWQSAFVSALFALHPLHVESVAWVAERKDVLSTFFWMLTMAAYVRYVERPRLRSYLLVVFAFVLGLMAKPMLVTLPFVLLLLDYWPLQRFQQNISVREIQTKANKAGGSDKPKGKSIKQTAVKEEVKEEKPANSPYQWTLIRPLLLEKIPLLGLAILSSIVTYIAQQKGGTVASIEEFPLTIRIANAFVSYITYIANMFWPNDLAVFYPYPGSRPAWQIWASIALFTAVTLLVIRTAKKFQYLAVGWLWYAGTLVPVIGIIQVGLQSRADRYTYIPLIGLFIMAAWGIPQLLGTWRHRKEALFASSALILSSLFILTGTQVGYWHNSITLFDHTLKVTDHNLSAYNNRGNAYYNLGNYKQAIEDFDKAIEVDPKYAEAYINRGLAYADLGNRRQAIEDYNKAIEVDPRHAETYNNRANAFYGLGNQRQAIEDYGKAIEVNPQYGEAYYNRGNVYYSLGDQRQAIKDYDKAIEVYPDYAGAYANRGNAYADLGDNGRAIEDYSKALKVNPRYAEVYYNRGNAFFKLGNQRQAIEDYNKFIEINPRDASAYLNRGSAHASLGNYMQAIEDFDRAIEGNPQNAGAYANRGNASMAIGNKERAIEDLKRAARLGHKGAQNSLISQGVTW